MAHLVLALTGPNVANAQVAQATRLAELDNDYFDFAKDPERRSDDNYSHGVRMGFTNPVGSSRPSRALCLRSNACALSVWLGQQLYSPTVEDTVPIPGQRPHAGWLYGEVVVGALSARQRFAYGLTVGALGPNARADDLQRWLHSQVEGFRVPVGWEHQLANEIAFAVRGDVQHVYVIGDRQRWSAEATPSISALVGTLRTSGTATLRLRAGWGVRHPWIYEKPAELALYGILGAGGEVVERSIFLDGNTYRNSHSVASQSSLKTWERGFGVRMLKLSIEYLVVSTTREYRDGPSVHTYGRVAVLWQH